ncbi:MAG: hypothetical protein K8L99_24750 [Anaerolineae bacterium]|nr:hypothetical protein [Anaerolineae bacterium]
MRLIERVLYLILGLLAITLVTVIFAVPEALSTFFLSVSDVNFIFRLVGVLVVDIAILALVYVRLRPRRMTGDGLVVKASGAVADVSVESARTLILNTVKQVPDVTAATATLKAVDGKADIELDVNVQGQTVNVPKKQQEINRALKQVVYKQLGLQLAGQPRVHIKLNGDSIGLEKPDADVVVIPEKAEKPDEKPTVVVTDTKQSDDVDVKVEEPRRLGGLFARQPTEKPADQPASLDKPSEVETPPEHDVDDWLESYDVEAGNSQSSNQKS